MLVSEAVLRSSQDPCRDRVRMGMSCTVVYRDSGVLVQVCVSVRDTSVESSRSSDPQGEPERSSSLVETGITYCRYPCPHRSEALGYVRLRYTVYVAADMRDAVARAAREQA